MDHPTPISVETHSRDPVPFTVASDGVDTNGMESFDEAAAKEGGYVLVEATELGWEGEIIMRGCPQINSERLIWVL